MAIPFRFLRWRRLTQALAFSTALIAQPNLYADSGDFAGVRAAVQKYFDGTSIGKPELIAEAFLPSLELQSVRKGKLQRRKAPDYIAGFEPGVEYDRQSRLISMDVSADAAMAKAEIVMAGRRYIDYLLLLKIDGEWRISNKIYTAL